MSAGFTLRLTNQQTEVTRLIDAFTDFGRVHALSDRVIHSVSLALDELVTNVISYGLPPGGPYEIAAAIRLDGGRLVAEITDPGVPFNPFEDGPAPDFESDLEDRRVGGLGIYLVKKLMDETVYRREGATNRIVIAKALSSG